MVKITICWSSEFESSETDIVEGLVVNNHTLVSVLNQLMYGQSGVVGLNNCVRDLW